MKKLLLFFILIFGIWGLNLQEVQGDVLSVANFKVNGSTSIIADFDTHLDFEAYHQGAVGCDMLLYSENNNLLGSYKQAGAGGVSGNYWGGGTLTFTTQDGSFNSSSYASQPYGGYNFEVVCDDGSGMQIVRQRVYVDFSPPPPPPSLTIVRVYAGDYVSWVLSPGGCSGRGNSPKGSCTVSSGTHSISGTPDSGYQIDDYSSSDSANTTSLYISSGETKSFTISSSIISPALCDLSSFSGPSSVAYGATATLLWTSANCTLGMLSGGELGSPGVDTGISANPNNGWTSNPLTQTTTYSLTASNSSNSVTKYWTVNVDPAFDYSISATNVTIQKSSTQTVSGANSVTRTHLAGPTQSTNFTSIYDYPSGVTYSIGTDSCAPTCGSTITFYVAPSAPTGSNTVNICTSQPIRCTSFTLTITDAPPVVSVPQPPSGFSASPSYCSNNWLNLSWNASSGATSYQVYRSGALVYNGPNTYFSDTGLALSTTYSYSLTASNSSGTSASVFTSGTTASPCFDYSLSATNVTIQKGSSTVSGSNTVSKSLISGASQDVVFTGIQGIPSGVTYGLGGSDPCKPTCSNPVTWYVSPSAPSGSHTITMYSSPLSKQVTFTLTITDAPVPPPSCTLDFTVASGYNPVPYNTPTELRWTTGNCTSGNLYGGEYNGIGILSGGPSSGIRTSNLTETTTYSITAGNSVNSVTKSVTVSVGSEAFAYSLSVTPTNLSIKKSGQTVTGAVTVSKNKTSTITEPVSLSVSGLPSGVTYSTDNVCAPNCGTILTFFVSPGTPARTYPLTIIGSPLGMTAPLTLIVNKKDELPATIYVTSSGASGSWTINGSNGETKSGTGSGSATVNPEEGGAFYTITGGSVNGSDGPVITNTTVSNPVPGQNYPTVLVSPDQTVGFTLTYTPSFNYTLSVEDDPVIVRKGGSDRYGETLIYKAFTGNPQSVDLSISFPSGQPVGVEASLQPSQCPPSCDSSNLQFIVDRNTLPGSYPVRVTGSPLGKTVNFFLRVDDSPAIIVNCSAMTNPATLGSEVTWTGAVSGGVPPYTNFSWSAIGGTPSSASTPTNDPFRTTYSTVGTKRATLTVRDNNELTGTCSPPGEVRINFNPKIEEF